MGAPDVVIVGAGPAGAIAGLALARAGARVQILDRATFPRDKLCGDTVNPGTLARLRALGVAGEVEARGLRVDGMVLTGEGGVAVEGRYPEDVWGRAMLRRDLDSILLEQAIAAGCRFEAGVTVRRPVVGEQRVTGVIISGRGGGDLAVSAPVIIGADGRRSTLAFGLGLARHPDRPRRWAVGAYFTDFVMKSVAMKSESSRDRIGRQSDTEWQAVNDAPEEDPAPEVISQRSRIRFRLQSDSHLGEMHVRRGRYIGVAPVPGGLTNVCVVKPTAAADPELADPRSLLLHTLAADPVLRDRAAGARLVSVPVVLGPLAVDAVAGVAFDGLLLAGDAAGFIDPMTGDGLRFAVRGAELAAAAALDALAHGWPGVHTRLSAARARAFAGKCRFNRALRALVASPRGLDAAAVGARFAPALFRAVIAHAGDCAAAC